MSELESTLALQENFGIRPFKNTIDEQLKLTLIDDNEEITLSTSQKRLHQNEKQKNNLSTAQQNSDILTNLYIIKRRSARVKNVCRVKRTSLHNKSPKSSFGHDSIQSQLSKSWAVTLDEAIFGSRISEFMGKYVNKKAIKFMDSDKGLEVKISHEIVVSEKIQELRTLIQFFDNIMKAIPKKTLTVFTDSRASTVHISEETGREIIEHKIELSHLIIRTLTHLSVNYACSFSCSNFSWNLVPSKIWTPQFKYEFLTIFAQFMVKNIYMSPWNNADPLEALQNFEENQMIDENNGNLNKEIAQDIPWDDSENNMTPGISEQTKINDDEKTFLLNKKGRLLSLVMCALEIQIDIHINNALVGERVLSREIDPNFVEGRSLWHSLNFPRSPGKDCIIPGYLISRLYRLLQKWFLELPDTSYLVRKRPKQSSLDKDQFLIKQNAIFIGFMLMRIFRLGVLMKSLEMIEIIQATKRQSGDASRKKQLEKVRDNDDDLNAQRLLLQTHTKLVALKNDIEDHIFRSGFIAKMFLRLERDVKFLEPEPEVKLLGPEPEAVKGSSVEEDIINYRLITESEARVKNFGDSAKLSSDSPNSWKILCMNCQNFNSWSGLTLLNWQEWIMCLIPNFNSFSVNPSFDENTHFNVVDILNTHDNNNSNNPNDVLANVNETQANCSDRLIEIMANFDDMGIPVNATYICVLKKYLTNQITRFDEIQLHWQEMDLTLELFHSSLRLLSRVDPDPDCYLSSSLTGQIEELIDLCLALISKFPGFYPNIDPNNHTISKNCLSDIDASNDIYNVDNSELDHMLTQKKNWWIFLEDLKSRCSYLSVGRLKSTLCQGGGKRVLTPFLALYQALKCFEKECGTYSNFIDNDIYFNTKADFTSANADANKADNFCERGLNLEEILSKAEASLFNYAKDDKKEDEGNGDKGNINNDIDVPNNAKDTECVEVVKMDIDKLSVELKVDSKEMTENEENLDKRLEWLDHISEWDLMPLSLKYLEMCHDMFASHHICTMENGAFLKFYVSQLYSEALKVIAQIHKWERIITEDDERPKNFYANSVKCISIFDKLEDLKEELSSKMEQAYFCMYDFTCKKWKNNRALVDHKSYFTKVKFSLDQAPTLFNFLKPSKLPTFHTKANTINSEIKDLLEYILKFCHESYNNTKAVNRDGYFLEGESNILLTDINDRNDDYKAMKKYLETGELFRMEDDEPIAKCDINFLDSPISSPLLISRLRSLIHFILNGEDILLEEDGDKLIDNGIKTSLMESIFKEMYYLLADYYFKNMYTCKALKYYLLDLCYQNATMDRFDSWAGIALVRSSLFEHSLRTININFESFPHSSHYKGTLACFDRALKSHEHFSNYDTESIHARTSLWVEKGALAYMLSSTASRKLKRDFLFGLSDQEKESLINFQEEMLKISKFCYESASLITDSNQERWLYSYMLGKIGEKTAKQDPEVYLKHYQESMGYLHRLGCYYPKKINFHSPQFLSIEILELFYRIHASILKYLEINKYFKDSSYGDELAIIFKILNRNLDKVWCSPFIVAIYDRGNMDSTVNMGTPLNEADKGPYTQFSACQQTSDNILNHKQSKRMRTGEFRRHSETKNSFFDEQSYCPPENIFTTDYDSKKWDPENARLGEKHDKMDTCVSIIIEKCLRGLKVCLSRFQQHYKSFYRLSYHYFTFDPINKFNIELARKLMVDPYVDLEFPLKISSNWRQNFNEERSSNAATIAKETNSTTTQIGSEFLPITMEYSEMANKRVVTSSNSNDNMQTLNLADIQPKVLEPEFKSKTVESSIAKALLEPNIDEQVVVPLINDSFSEERGTLFRAFDGLPNQINDIKTNLAYSSSHISNIIYRHETDSIPLLFNNVPNLDIKAMTSSTTSPYPFVLDTPLLFSPPKTASTNVFASLNQNSKITDTFPNLLSLFTNVSPVLTDNKFNYLDSTHLATYSKSNSGIQPNDNFLSTNPLTLQSESLNDTNFPFNHDSGTQLCSNSYNNNTQIDVVIADDKNAVSLPNLDKPNQCLHNTDYEALFLANTSTPPFDAPLEENYNCSSVFSVPNFIPDFNLNMLNSDIRISTLLTEPNIIPSYSNSTIQFLPRISNQLDILTTNHNFISYNNNSLSTHNLITPAVSLLTQTQPNELATGSISSIFEPSPILLPYLEAEITDPNLNNPNSSPSYLNPWTEILSTPLQTPPINVPSNSFITPLEVGQMTNPNTPIPNLGIVKFRVHSLFGDRTKKCNSPQIFNTIWRLPVEESDRPGSFAGHVFRSAVLLARISLLTRDINTLYRLIRQTKKSPERDKKYIYENERIYLNEMCLKYLEKLS
ncbi:uncharacterized protein LOC135928161 isoform X2 [Gordionus sp. m RMFG-2023]|uniref:uncharacterized protein LOC135928161 isoform X2 n=1 Tax=Gordionus sp. m RMFG-2023 TaxID=3053472 RepID=UPI0031FBFA5A